jgi:hypothetical protein
VAGGEEGEPDRRESLLHKISILVSGSYQMALTSLSLIDTSAEQLGLLNGLSRLVVLLALLGTEKASAGAFVGRDLHEDAMGGLGGSSIILVHNHIERAIQAHFRCETSEMIWFQMCKLYLHVLPTNNLLIWSLVLWQQSAGRNLRTVNRVIMEENVTEEKIRPP